jgi:hypothetical protein
MHGRCAWLRRLAIERLEGRDLPSAMALVRPTDVELPGDYQGVVEVVSSMATLQENRRALTHSPGRSLDDHGQISRRENGNALAPPPAVRNNPETTDDSKRPPSQNVAPRELADPVVLDTRRTDLASDALDDDPPAIGQAMMSGQSGGAAAESASASGLVAWALGAAMPVTLSLAILPGPIVGSDGQAGESAGETRLVWLVGSVFPKLERGEPTPSAARTAASPAGGEPLDRNPPAWANLLEGALHADWEVIDGELRQFLSGLGGLAQHTNESGAGLTWPLWTGVATALLLARRATYVPRRLFRRPVLGALRASTRRPVPVGPWPLSSP